MTKQQQFLFIVQTVILTNSVNLAAQSGSEYRHVFSATGVLRLAGDALYASERIPDDMSALEAATEFCRYMLDNLREAEIPAQKTPPAWLGKQ